MSDISKCGGTGCKIKRECYRYTAPVNPYWQAWADFKKDLKEQGTFCESYMPIANADEAIKQEAA